MSRRRRIAWAAAGAVLLAGDGLAEVRRDQPLTVAKAIELAINEHDAAAVDARVDRATLVDRALAGTPATVGERLVIGRDLRHDLHVGAMLVAARGDAGHARLLAVRDTPPRALLRVVRDVTGINYYELHLGAGDTGDLRIVDVYMHRSGELLSDALHRSCVRHLHAAHGLHHLIPPAARMDDLIERGWHAEALRFVDGLPAATRDRTVLLQALLCAREVGDEAADRAWAVARGSLPDDPGADLFMLPDLLDGHRVDDALAAIERLRTLIHDDPYLDALAARVLLETGGFDRARGFVERVVRDEPDLELGWTLRLRLTLARHDHPETARTLAVLRRRFGYRFQHLETNPDYQAFVQSDAYEPP